MTTEEQQTSESPALETEEQSPKDTTQEDKTEERQEDKQDEKQETKTEGKTFSEDYVSSLRKESAGYRTRAQQAESRVKELEGGQSNELTSAQQENETLKGENQELRGRIRRSAFIEQIGLPSPRLAWASLSDLSIDVEYDDDDRPKNLEKIRTALKKEFPREFGDGSADGASHTTGSDTQVTPGYGRLRAAYNNTT